MNLVILTGNIGNNAEIKTLQDGKSVTNFSLCTNEYYNNENHATWHRITVWGEYGTKIADKLTKGRTITLQGKIEYSKYTKDNVECQSVNINASRIEFIGKSDIEQTPKVQPTFTQQPMVNQQPLNNNYNQQPSFNNPSHPNMVTINQQQNSFQQPQPMTNNTYQQHVMNNGTQGMNNHSNRNFQQPQMSNNFQQPFAQSDDLPF